MDKINFIKLMEESLRQINIDLPESKISQFYLYKDILLKWNDKINLTAITEEKEIIIKHFIDSLTINKYIGDKKTLLDVGTGAGFPGIPLKIINENLEVTLLDSLNKRILFLNEIIEKLELKKINAVHSRAEDFAINKNFREKFDVVTARAVANLPILLEYLLPFVKVGGICICMKGSEVTEELENSKRALDILGGKIEFLEEFKLPETEYKRNIIIVKKVKDTPKQYPRKAGNPLRNPIN